MIERAFTLIELVIVILVVGVMMALLSVQSGTYSSWRDESFLRQFCETIEFLHHQAIVDQSFYVMKLDFDNNQYAVEVMEGEKGINEELVNVAQDAGNLSLELAAFLSPALGKSQVLIPPPTLPSLAEPVNLPGKTQYIDARTMRGLGQATEGGAPYILFSPRGFSEFGVIHLKLSNGSIVTVLINPFTGLTDIYRSYKDFEWTYGKNRES